MEIVSDGTRTAEYLGVKTLRRYSLSISSENGELAQHLSDKAGAALQTLIDATLEPTGTNFSLKLTLTETFQTIESLTTSEETSMSDGSARRFWRDYGHNALPCNDVRPGSPAVRCLLVYDHPGPHAYWIGESYEAPPVSVYSTFYGWGRPDVVDSGSEPSGTDKP